MDINNKVAIVTGGVSGLGEATVRLYASLGAKVAIFDMNEALAMKLLPSLVSMQWILVLATMELTSLLV